MQSKFRMFKSSFKSWETLFEEATTFASEIGVDRVISVSHSCDHGMSVVVVWYWEE